MNNLLNQMKPIGRIAAAKMAVHSVPMEFTPTLVDVFNSSGLNASFQNKLTPDKVVEPAKGATISIAILITIIAGLLINNHLNASKEKE